MSQSTNQPTPIALFVTCLVDLFRPEVGEATVALLERQGLRVEFPEAQTCCGAPAFHAGWWKEATELAQRWIEIFEPFPVIVSPSPVCVAMVRQEYPQLLANDVHWRSRAEAVAARTYELSEFLVDVLGVTDLGARFEGKITYQPACQALRMLQVDRQPRALLAAVQGAELTPLADADACCGFGGLFSAQMPQVSAAVAERKARAITKSQADLVITGETGCVLHMAGALSRRGSACQAVHLAELLAGQAPSAQSTAL